MMKNLVNITPKEPNKSPITDPKETEIYELPFDRNVLLTSEHPVAFS